MTDHTSTASLSGEPCIARPTSSRLECAAFFIVRKWPWLCFAAAFLVLAVAIIALVAAIKLGSENVRLSPLQSSTLIALPALLLGIGIMPWQQNRPAPPWLIRAALSSATDEERAFLYERLQRHGQSQFETKPLDVQALVRFFDSAREEYGQRAIRKRERKDRAKAHQEDVLRSLAGAE